MSSTSLRKILLSGAVAVAVVATVAVTFRPWADDAPDDGCSIGPDGPTRMSAYEWREVAWRGAEAGRDLVRTAQRLCLDRVYVDVTAAGAAGESAAADLARDVAELSRTAASAGLEVGVVAGDPWWPTDEGRVDVERLLRFVAGLVDEGVAIAGLHLDVEPWGLEAWAGSKDELVEQYLRFVIWTERIRDELVPSVPVAYLVPYWFDGSNGEVSTVEVDGRSAVPFDHLAAGISAGGSLSVMAYRDRAAGEGGIVDLVRHEFGQQQVPVLVGVETTEIDPPTATFAGATLAALLDELDSVAEATGTEEIVVNDVDGLRRLTDPAGTPAD